MRRARFRAASRRPRGASRQRLLPRCGLPAPCLAIGRSDHRLAQNDWRELFKGIYLKRTLTIWGLWVCVYMINNGLVTWLPTLYKQVFQLPLQTSLAYGWITSAVGVIASIICALLIDKVGRKPWYATAFLVGTIPLLMLSW